MYKLVVLLVATNLPTIIDMTQTILNIQIMDIGSSPAMLMDTSQIMLKETCQLMLMGTNQDSHMGTNLTTMGTSLLIPV